MGTIAKTGVGVSFWAPPLFFKNEENSKNDKEEGQMTHGTVCN
jgi:hypothetical protein